MQGGLVCMCNICKSQDWAYFSQSQTTHNAEIYANAAQVET